MRNKLPPVEVGNRYGQLTVKEKLPQGKRLVRCDCGNEKIVTGGNLNAGNAISCGVNCLLKFQEGRALSIGQRFSFLTVKELLAPRTAILSCVCGKTVKESASELENGQRKSCGCKSTPYSIGQIVNGREVVGLASHANPCLKVKCTKCGNISKVRAGYRPDAKCRACDPFDTRLKNGSVYALTCPFLGEIRYVGATSKTLDDRMDDHLHCAKHPKKKNKPVYQWISELMAHGAIPGMITLETVSDGTLANCEVFWIKKLSNQGTRLLNIEHNMKLKKEAGDAT